MSRPNQYTDSAENIAVERILAQFGVGTETDEAAKPPRA